MKGPEVIFAASGRSCILTCASYFEERIQFYERSRFIRLLAANDNSSLLLIIEQLPERAQLSKDFADYAELDSDD